MQQKRLNSSFHSNNSRISSAHSKYSGRSNSSMTYDSKRQDTYDVYRRNRNMGKSFRAKEKGIDLNKRNSLIFKKIQDLHAVSYNC